MVVSNTSAWATLIELKKVGFIDSHEPHHLHPMKKVLEVYEESKWIKYTNLDDLPDEFLWRGEDKVIHTGCKVGTPFSGEDYILEYQPIGGNHGY